MTFFLGKKYNGYIIAAILLGVIMANIFIKSYYHHDGRISPDSAEYLSISKKILEMGSFYSSSNPILGKNESYFSIWPLGYPFSIAFVGYFTKLSVFWSSKLCNAIFLLFSGFLLIKEYREKSYLFIICFGFASYLFIFSSTYSETGFIFSLIYFSISLKKTILTQASFISIFNLFLSSSLIFLFRYTGVFINFLLAIIIINSIKNFGFSKYNIRLILTSLIIGILQVGYLTVNLLNAGSITGISRPFLIRGIGVITIKFIKGILGELVLVAPYFNFYLFLVSIVLIGLIFKYQKIKLKSFESSILGNCFLFTGVFYMFFIYIIGLLTQFSDFNYRFLAPGTLLILFYLIDKFHYFNPTVNLKIEVCLFVFFICSICFSIRDSSKDFRKNRNTYNEEIAFISQNINDITPNSIIIHPNKHLKYILSNVIFFDDWFLSDPVNFEKLKCYYPNRDIFINTDNTFIKY